MTKRWIVTAQFGPSSGVYAWTKGGRWVRRMVGVNEGLWVTYDEIGDALHIAGEKTRIEREKNPNTDTDFSIEEHVF